jgi:arsenate reductase
MEKITIYHNPICSKSRCALDYLKEKNLDFALVEYLKKPPSKEELKSIISTLGIPAEELIRKGEAIFKEHFKGKTLTDDEWIEAMLSYPKLIERPIVVIGNKAVVARPTERIEEIL